jgi:hypothetical protein
VPLVLRLNKHDLLQDEVDSLGAQTSSMADAMQMLDKMIRIYRGEND